MGYKKTYIKDESHDPIYNVKNGKFLVKSRILPLTLILCGILILGTQVILPLAFFKSTKKSNTMESSVLGVMSGFKDFEFEELANEVGETKVTETVGDAYLTIPKLGIKNAVVEINSPSMDPKEALGHYEKLEAGDEIIIESTGDKFTYLVENKETLYPTDVNPLEETKPTFLNESTMTLMTCTPPGTKLKRLLIHAVKIN